MKQIFEYSIIVLVLFLIVAATVGIVYLGIMYSIVIPILVTFSFILMAIILIIVLHDILFN